MPVVVAWPTAAGVPWPSSSASHPTAHSPRSGDPGGAALNLNVHIHALVLDGVFTSDDAGGVRFCPLEPRGADDLGALLTTIERRIEKLLAAASVRGVAALGARASMGSISMRALSYRRVRVSAWNGCAAMPCVRRSARIGCS